MDRLLIVSELSELFSISEDRVYALSREKVIPSVRLGRSLRFDPEEIKQFVKNGGKALPGVWKREPT
jgi:excisionase family DNA binding protein